MTPQNVLRITTHFFVRITTHIFARIATQLERCEHKISAEVTTQLEHRLAKKSHFPGEARLSGGASRRAWPSHVKEEEREGRLEGDSKGDLLVASRSLNSVRSGSKEASKNMEFEQICVEKITICHGPDEQLIIVFIWYQAMSSLIRYKT